MEPSLSTSREVVATPLLDERQKRVLARFARNAIRQALGGPLVERPSESFCETPGACFVTLHRRDDLHGCIGSIEPRRALIDDVAHSAVAAALWDPRAGDLSLAGVDDLTVEVSVLSPLAPIEFSDEESALAALRPGVDGVVFEYRSYRGTFLPQVWESLPEPPEFMARLRTKAGLASDFWADGIALWRFSVQKCIDPPGASAAA